MCKYGLLLFVRHSSGYLPVNELQLFVQTTLRKQESFLLKKNEKENGKTKQNDILMTVKLFNDECIFESCSCLM